MDGAVAGVVLDVGPPAMTRSGGGRPGHEKGR